MMSLAALGQSGRGLCFHFGVIWPKLIALDVRIRYTWTMSKKPIALSVLIRGAREASDLSQQALADLVGVHRSFIARLEIASKDAENPTLDVLLALEAALDAGLFSGALQPHVAARRRAMKKGAAKS